MIIFHFHPIFKIELKLSNQRTFSIRIQIFLIGVTLEMTPSSNPGNSSLTLSEERFHGVLDIEKKRLFRKYGFDFVSYVYSQFTPPSFYLQIISVW